MSDVAEIDDCHAAHPDRRIVQAHWRYKPHKRRRDIVLPDNASTYVRPIEDDERETLVKSIAQRRHLLREIVRGANIRVVALRNGRSERMIRMLVTLAFFDPKLVRAILLGASPRGVNTRRLIDAPAFWDDQWQKLGLSRRTDRLFEL